MMILDLPIARPVRGRPASPTPYWAAYPLPWLDMSIPPAMPAVLVSRKMGRWPMYRMPDNPSWDNATLPSGAPAVETIIQERGLVLSLITTTPDTRRDVFGALVHVPVNHPLMCSIAPQEANWLRWQRWFAADVQERVNLFRASRPIPAQPPTE